MNNQAADQTGWMGRRVCALIVYMQQSLVFTCPSILGDTGVIHSVLTEMQYSWYGMDHAWNTEDGFEAANLNLAIDYALL